MSIEILGPYYGVDWLAMILTLIGIYLLGDKKRVGFMVHILGNFLWAILGIMTMSIALMIANVVYLFFNIRGYQKWKKK